MLKKDVIKSQSKDLDKGDEYRQILVQAIHSCAIKFPAVAANVILLLMGNPSLDACTSRGSHDYDLHRIWLQAFLDKEWKIGASFALMTAGHIQKLF